MSTKVVERKPLTAYERTYLPSFLGGLGVIWKHLNETSLRLVKEPHAKLIASTPATLTPYLSQL